MHARRSCLAAPIALVIAAVAAQPATAAPAQSSVVSATPASFTPNVKDGVVNAIVPVANGELVAAGKFTQVKRGSVAVARTSIFAFDQSTGRIDTGFAPNVAGGEVRSAVAAPDGSAVYIAGNFTSVNGVATRVARISFPSGQLDPAFSVNVNGSAVNKLVLADGKLYLGGSFKQVNGKTRSDIAAVDPTTGALDKTFNVKVSTPRYSQPGVRTGLVVWNMAASPDGHYLLMSGTFTSVGGQPRDQVAMLDLTTNPVSVAPWSTDKFNHMCSRTYDTYVRGIDFSPDGSYFAIGDTGAWSNGPFDTSNDGSGLPTNQGTLCDSVSRWEMNPADTDAQPSWVDYTGGDSITQVSVTGAAIYAGGHARWMNNPFGSDFPGGGGVVRTGIAALDPINGMPLPWNPSRTRGKGVFALLPTSTGLWVGSDTATFANLDRERIAYLPLAGGEVVPRFQSAPVPAGQPANLDPAAIRAAFRVVGDLGSDRVYFASSDGSMYVAPYDATTGYGTATVVDLHGMMASCAGMLYFGGCQADGITLGNSIIGFPVARITSMSYDAASGRLDYTLAGDARSFSRYFEADGDIVGSQGFVAP